MLSFNQGKWFRNADFCVSLEVFRTESQYFYPYSYRLADVLRIATKNSCIGDLYSFNRAWRNFRNVEDEKKKEESIQRNQFLIAIEIPRALLFDCLYILEGYILRVK